LRAAFIRCGLRLRALWTPSSGVELVPVVGARGLWIKAAFETHALGSRWVFAT
jgi:hypothetical protein